MKNDVVGMHHFVWILLLLWIGLLKEAKGEFDANFTLQNVWGRLQPDMRSLIQCQSDENHKKIKFSRMLDTGQGAKLPKLSQQFMQGKPVYARILFMPGDDKLTRFGAFQCKITKKDVTTRIVTLKLPPSNLEWCLCCQLNLELEALSPYNVANVGEDIFLELNVTKKLELPIKWRHDGKELPDWTGMKKVELKNVSVSDAGIYEAYYEGRRNEGVHALMRVLVRSCPADLHGENCDKECPPCYNGGICQDKWGVCVCPAGFTGENCEIACGGNHFGPDCLKFCSPPQNNSNTDELCALHLFCKPDPYGCSCAPGFKGSRCMEHCAPGWYGADCKQPCHCAYGISNCNRITGACDGGCARGWRGNSCQIYDPNSNSSYVETTTMVYCSPGSYGPSCERQCHCAGNEHCHIVSGICPSGCEDGWGGPTCGACRTGRFGENCEFSCHCEGGHHNCDNKDGYCYSGCEAGWAGFTCQAECTPGRFGPNCASTCHCHPNSTNPCDKFTGKCEGDCEAGFMGEDCQILCPPTMYGVNCVNKCTCSNGAKCTRFDGSCTCEGRWRGITCNESEPQISAARDEEINVNYQIILFCTADAVPEPVMNITSSAFPGLDVINRTLEQNQKQVFVKVKPTTVGRFEFMCTARNEHGFDMKKITLTAIGPPRLKSPPVLVSKNNDSISLQWKAWEYLVDEGGSPTDTIEYMVVYKDSQSSEWEKVDSWITRENYTIDNLIPNTLYSVAIKCRRMGKGVGGGGEGDPGPLLQVKTDCGVALPEGIPQEFLPEKITQTYVTLTWQNPPEALLRCSLISYHVTYQPEAFQLFKGTLDTEGIINNITIEDLSPYMTYLFRIYPVTALGRSSYYAELNMRTAETVPGPVLNLQCQAVAEKPELLLVSWDAASEENGIIRGYIVTFILVDRGKCGPDGEQNDTVHTRQIQSDDSEIALQNLHPYSIYNVSVQAKTFAGEGEAVSTLATTAESVPSEAPRHVTGIFSTNNSLAFVWDNIPCQEANGELLYYVYALIQKQDVVNVVSGLRTKRSLGDPTLTVFDYVEDHGVIIEDLKPFTIYGFMVGGATTAGTGIMSDVIFYRTDEGIPDAPSALQGYLLSHDSIGVTWEAPVSPNGIISQYRIRAYVRETSVLASEVVQNSENEQGSHSVVPGLSPATEYMITVEAQTSAGWGKESSMFETTLDAAPGEPEEVTVTDNQQTTLNITWKEPLETNGVIIGYKVEYNTISSLDPLFDVIPSDVKIRHLNGDVNDVFLQDLHPSTQYSVSVFAQTSEGYGPPATLQCWTVILGDHVSPSLKIVKYEATNDTIPIVFSTTGSSSVQIPATNHTEWEREAQPLNPRSSKYQVIVEDGRNDDPIDEEQLTDYQTAVVEKGLPYYIAAELDPSNVSQSGEETFIVGDRQMWGGYKNVHLNPGHQYKIRIRTLLVKDAELKSVLSKPKNETAETTVFRIDRKKTLIAGMEVIVFALILIVCLVFLIAVTFITVFTACYRRQRKKSTTSFSTKDSGLSGSLTWSVMYKTPDADPTMESHYVADGFRTFPLTEKNASLKRCRSDSKIARGMRIETLEDYLMSARNTNQLTVEFQKLVDGQTSSWTVARKSGNLKKNRYGNILPYDRYRVVLQTESSKGDADYINASYIDGFRRPKEYIVTQGPLGSTICDFWRMIWQENSPVIIMVTDLIENGKVKCAKYWPEDSMDYGEMHMLLIHVEESTDYVVRTILMRKIDEIRTHRVIQYQYTGWPDKGVPQNINSFIKFMKKVRDDHPVMSGPMVVHCSAGTGRSGTYVAIDALCQQAAEDRRVDVFRFVNNARHQRVNLVQTQEQYAFIYEALVEAIQFEDTSIPLQNICLYLKELNHMSTLDRRAIILKQYNKLNRAQKKVDVSQCSVALSEANIFKNRDPLTVPSDTARVKLEVIYDEGEEEYGDYINAISVDGYRKHGAYLVTQMPLTHTIEDFYRLIYQHKSTLILMLNGCDESDEMSVGIYWPELGECKYGDFYVQLLTFEEQGDFVIRVLKLTNLRHVNVEPLKIIQLQYNGWSSEMKSASMLNLIDVVETWYARAGEGPITVHCMDGATRSGLFIAASYVCEQVKHEGVLDAFHIVRSIRINRPEFIPNSEQFRLLFEVAQEIAEPILFQHEENGTATKKLSFKI